MTATATGLNYGMQSPSAVLGPTSELRIPGSRSELDLSDNPTSCYLKVPAYIKAFRVAGEHLGQLALRVTKPVLLTSKVVAPQIRLSESTTLTSSRLV